MITLRPASERGHAEHGWLDSFHSFSFADYHDPRHMGFGPLRVINEDRVKPGMGFGTHGHRDMEILSYVLEGALSHKDSIGTGSTIVPGDVQRMSAGRGVMHSEFNPSPTQGVHFLQIWIEPDVRGIPPSYEQATVGDDAKRGRLALIAAPQGAGGAVAIHQDAKLFATLLRDGERVVHALPEGRRAYVQVVRGAVNVNGVEAGAGDAVKLENETSVDIAHRGEAMLMAEVLLFDLP
jgi:redox-sensitive bicupin YhaK (pirin superfamily)